ncbi:TPA: hypothetical protein ROX98_001378 [Bacillus pseudomycoides]|nr:hypothetical protein [Bacillus pseudomycoides]
MPNNWGALLACHALEDGDFFRKYVKDFQGNLMQKGVAVTVDTARPDVTRFYVLDPFGDRIEFMERENSKKTRWL